MTEDEFRDLVHVRPKITKKGDEPCLRYMIRDFYGRAGHTADMADKGTDLYLKAVAKRLGVCKANGDPVDWEAVTFLKRVWS